MEPVSFGQGRYAVRRLIGEGGKKKVYLAEDTRLGRDVAVAVIKNEGMSEHEMARIRREAQAMAWLGDHPNVVTIHDIGEENGQTFIVGQYMEGGDVDALLERSGDKGLPVRDAVTITRAIAQALEHAHGKGIVHRDIKPGNVWLAADGTPKLGDFGLAMVADRTRITRAGTMLGTVHYMPPETALGGGRDADARSDIYSLGCMFYELLTGDPPFMGSMSKILNAHVDARPDPPSRRRPEIPHVIDRLVLQMIAKSPRERPSSAGQVIQALNMIERELENTPPADKAPPGPPKVWGEEIASKDTPPEQPSPLRSSSGPGVASDVPPPIPTSPEPPSPKPLRGIISREVKSTGSELIGRSELINDLDWVLGEANAGRGRMVLIEGAAGSGKSRLAEEVLSRAKAKDASTYRLTCPSSASQTPLSPWEPLVEELVAKFGVSKVATDFGDSLHTLARAFPGTASTLGDMPKPKKAASEQARGDMLSGIVRMLRRAAAGETTAILVENIGEIDQTSALLLWYLSESCNDTRLLVLITRELPETRQEPAPPEPLNPAIQLVKKIFQSEKLKRVHLDPLTQDETRKLASAVLEGIPNDAVTAALHRNGRGNPLFTVAASLALQAEKVLEAERPIDEWAVVVPQDLDDAIARLFDSMPEKTGQSLEAGAFYGDEFDIGAVAAISGLTESEVRSSLQRPMLIGLLRRGARPDLFEYSSTTVARKVRQRVRPERASEFNLAAAKLKDDRLAREESLVSGPAEVALQYSLSSEEDITERSVELFGLAADWAMKRLGFSESLQLATRALDLAVSAGSSKEALIPLKLRKARAALAAGEDADAQKSFLEAAEAARSAGDVPAMAEAVLGYGDSLPNMGIGNRNLTELLEAALALLIASSPEADGRERAVVTGRLALQYATGAPANQEKSRGIGQTARELTNAAYELGEKFGARRAVAYAMLARHFADPPGGSVEEVLGSALEIVWIGEEVGDPALSDQGRMLRIRAQLEGGRISAAIAEAELKGENDAPYGHSPYAWRAALLRAMQAIVAVRFEEAEALASEARDIGIRYGIDSVQAAYVAQLFAIRNAQGRLEEIKPLLDEIATENAGGIVWDVARAFVASQTGARGDAEEIFNRLVTRGLSSIPRDSSWPSVLWGLAEICVYLAGKENAGPIYEFLLPYADRYIVVGEGAVVVGSASRQLGRLSTLMGRLDEAVRHFETAVKMDSQLKAAELEAQSKMAFGEMLLGRDASGDREKAITYLSDAATTFQNLGIKNQMDRALDLKSRAQGARQGEEVPG